MRLSVCLRGGERVLSKVQLEDLAQVYRHILLDPSLLVQAAAQRGIEIRKAYEDVVTELADVEREITLAAKREEV